MFIGTVYVTEQSGKEYECPICKTHFRGGQDWFWRTGIRWGQTPVFYCGYKCMRIAEKRKRGK